MMKICPNRTSWLHLRGLLVQNPSHKGQERHGTTPDPQKPGKKLKNLDFGVSGVDGGSGGVCGPYFPLKGAPYWPCLGSPAVFILTLLGEPSAGLQPAGHVGLWALGYQVYAKVT